MQPNAGDELSPRPAPGDDAAFTLYPPPPPLPPPPPPPPSLVHLVRLPRPRCFPSPAAALAAGWPADHRDRGTADLAVRWARALGMARLALPAPGEAPHQTGGAPPRPGRG